MRLNPLPSLLGSVLALATVTVPAFAGAKILVRTQTYAVTGDTGAALVEAMDRSGPRYGFMTRAIARTTYTVDWDLQVHKVRRTCRLVRAVPTLHLTYVFPRAKGLPPGLSRRWKEFLAGVHRHEHRHGRIARDMVASAARSVSGLTVANDPSCNRTRREAHRRIDAVHEKYEVRQVAFDEREHADGGKVERLVGALMARR